MVREYEILQLKDDTELAVKRFMNLEWLQEHGMKPEREDYVSVYKGALLSHRGFDPIEFAEFIFEEFNKPPFPPKGYSGHSLSVSDVIIIQGDSGEIALYCNSVGFKQLDWRD